MSDFTRSFFCVEQAEAMTTDVKSRPPPTAATRAGGKPNFRVVPHEGAEDFLIKYRGLTLWMKEMDVRKAGELQRVSSALSIVISFLLLELLRLMLKDICWFFFSTVIRTSD